MYMALKHLGEISAALMAGGRDGDDPVTIVSNASMPHQQAAQTTLAEAGAFIAAQDPPTPAIIVVGRAADWRSLLDWYKGPLRENPIG
jgi:uroporphyrin-III C-methyltransferase